MNSLSARKIQSADRRARTRRISPGCSRTTSYQPRCLPLVRPVILAVVVVVAAVAAIVVIAVLTALHYIPVLSSSS